MSTILVVDDDGGLTRLMTKSLSREGFSTASASSGQEALKWLRDRQNTADLMLLDLKLPDIDAHSLIEHLSEIGRNLPFIIITGQGDERVAVEMMKRGALDYMVKDIQFLELLPMVVRRSLTHLHHKKLLITAEQLLKKEHAFSDAVLSTSGALMLVITPLGRIVRFNRACEDFTGYSLDEVKDRLYWEVFLFKTDWDSAAQEIEEMVSNCDAREKEGYILTKHHEQKYISWSLTVLVGHSGEAEFVIASGIDVTEKKKLEQEVLEISGREQRRIGQDLHDGLCQLLTGIDMLLRVLQKKIAQKSPEDTEFVTSISTYVKQAITQARTLAHGLFPVELETKGILSALQELASTVRALFNVNCTVKCAEDILLNDKVAATHLYRIAQEAINNAIKHGEARNISISLIIEETGGKMTVHDDGRGLRPDYQSMNGMGLRSMKYRASLINGRLILALIPSGGTEVTCEFPLARKSALPSNI